MAIRHLFWDFDGTLYDTYPQITRALQDALREFSIAAPPAEALGLLKVSVYRAACYYADKNGLDVQAVMEAFHKYHDAQMGFLPYAGLESCLRRLHDAGIRHYLYTHRDTRAVEQLQRDGLYRYFADAVTRTDGFPDKPAPDALLAMMARNGVRPEEAAMVGDRDIDIDAGHKAGMSGILFDPDGFYPALRVEMRVSSMRELSGLPLDTLGF